MSSRVDPVELGKLLDDSGISRKNRRKILARNSEPAETRGHGAASEVRTDFGSF